MAGARIEIQSIKLLQLANSLQRRRAERRLPVKRVQHNALQHVAQSHVVVLRECLEHLQNAFFDPYPGLYPLNFQFQIICHLYQCTMVPNINPDSDFALERQRETAREAQETAFPTAWQLCL